MTLRAPAAWIRVALVMFAVGWGANQFSPMLIVYRHALGLGSGEIAGLFAIYAATLIPGLLPADRCPTGSAAGRACCRSRPCRRWPRCCSSSARTACR